MGISDILAFNNDFSPTNLLDFNFLLNKYANNK